MKRNEITTAGALNVGDVFYKLNDKAKVKYTKVVGEVKRTQYATYSVSARKHGSKFSDAMKSNTEVVFLRSID